MIWYYFLTLHLYHVACSTVKQWYEIKTCRRLVGFRGLEARSEKGLPEKQPLLAICICFQFLIEFCFI